MKKLSIEEINARINALEEEKEELEIELEIANSEKTIYSALSGFTYTLGENTKAYFDEESLLVCCVIDKSKRDFKYEEEELLTDFDPYEEYDFDPYDYLTDGMSAKDILKSNPSKLVEEIEVACNMWFYSTLEKLGMWKW